MATKKARAKKATAVMTITLEYELDPKWYSSADPRKMIATDKENIKNDHDILKDFVDQFRDTVKFNIKLKDSKRVK